MSDGEMVVLAYGPRYSLWCVFSCVWSPLASSLSILKALVEMNDAFNLIKMIHQILLLLSQPLLPIHPAHG